VLVSVQSNKEFYRIMQENQEKRRMAMLQGGDHGMQIDTDGASMPKIIVVSLSSQSRASLANKFQFASMHEIWNVLYNLFVSHLGVDHVIDIDFARDISLMTSGCEFMNRFQKGQHLPVLTSACPGWICYAEK
jgi:iron only hydrogenase large subunit-like protein